ncbi:unnamed protein product [Callosobruchus maculatus]|nr:unnamed protein product [Callosobruchus maculatus]
MGGVSGFGITAGAHRLWTHRAYKAKLPLQAILLVCYSVAGQNSLLEWVRDHRVHHKFSETDADPHNAKRGFFFSHVGWLMMKKHPEVIRQGRKIDCSDILQEPMVAFYQRHFNWFKLLFCIIVPSAIPPLCWGESWYRSIVANFFCRYMLTANVTWCVNSLAHFSGWRPYDKAIYPAENWLVSFMAMGEGWHNYHHTFPWDYRTAEVGHWLNASTAWLNFFYLIGWAYDMKTASPELTASTATKHGDGSWKKGLENGKKERIRMKGR